MIGSGSGRRWRAGVLVGVLGALAAGAVFALRPAHPAEGDPPGHARRAAEARSAAAAGVDLLAALDAELAAAVAEVRRASAAVSSGEVAEPAEALEEAALAVERAREDRDSARDLVTDVAALAGCGTEAGAPQLQAGDGDFTRAANELRAAGPLADAIAAVRRHADATLSGLARAAAALAPAGRDPDAAAARAHHANAVESLEAARTAHDAVAPLMPTAAIWFGTVERLVRAQGAVIGAVRADDADAARSAAAEYRTASAEASLADRALAVGLADASASVLDPPVRELAQLRNAVADAAQRLRVIANTGTCG